MFLSLEIAGARDETSDVKRCLHSHSVQEIERRTVTPLPSKRSYTGLLTGRRSLAKWQQVQVSDVIEGWRCSSALR